MTEFEQACADASVQFTGKSLDLVKYGWDLAIEKSRDCLAQRALEAWTYTHQKQMQWATCIKIIAAITKMPDEERDRLIEYKN